MRSATDEVWSENCAAAGLFFKTNNRHPGTAALDPDERRLGQWLSRQRMVAKSGSLAQWRIAALNAVYPSWGGIDADSAWRESGAVAGVFFKKNGRHPNKEAVDPDERRLGQWLSKQRTAANSSSLTQWRIDALDAVYPLWRGIDADSMWRENCDACRVFFAENCRHPSTTAVSPDERRLGNWLSSQRTAANSDSLTQLRIDALDAAYSLWRGVDADVAWREKCDACSGFFAENSRHPNAKAALDSDERRLGSWLSGQRTAAKSGSLPQRRIDALDAVYPSWRSIDVASVWRENCDACSAFFAENCRHPSATAVDPDEMRLGKWLRKQRTTANSGSLTQWRIDALDAVYPLWRGIDADSMWRENCDACSVFFAENCRHPSTTAVSPDERRLGKWLSHQRTAANSDSLTQWRIDALDAAYSLWRGVDADSAWREKCDACSGFFAENRRHPSATATTADSNERRLGQWLSKQRTAANSGSLAQWRADALDAGNPLWRVGDGRVTTARMVEFVRYLVEHYDTLDESELLSIAIQDGVDADRAGLITRTARDVLTGRFAMEQVPDVVAGREAEVEAKEDDPTSSPPGSDDEPNDDADVTVLLGVRNVPDLIAQSARAVAWATAHGADEEVVDFLIAKAVHRLWSVAYTSGASELDALLAATDLGAKGDAYGERIRSAFRAELDLALDTVPPEGWAFRPTINKKPSATVVEPNLMQRHVASQVVARRRLGNWSGTGAGKTLSAVLAARLDNAGRDGIVMVVCPNAVVDTWAEVVKSVYPGTRVTTKDLDPVWEGGDGPRWLIVNFDRLLERGEGAIRRLIETHGVDMLIVDEVHQAKERKGGRSAGKSQRRRILEGIVTHTFERTPGAALLVMSATPVVNELYEAISLLKLVEGSELDDMQDAPTISNAVMVHQHLVRHGVRWLPTYSATLDDVRVPVDATDLLDDLVAARQSSSCDAAIERVLIHAKIPVIVAEALAAKERGSRTLVYTEFLTGIIDPIRDALEAAGLRVGEYSGEDKSGIVRFTGTYPDGTAVPTSTQVDVLIGTSAISTGVDGLQDVADTLVFAGLPWTFAGWTQVIGRIHRQGQSAARVRVVTPMTSVTRPNGTLWEYDEGRMACVRYKHDLAGAAVDGTLPDGVNLLSGHKFARKWLDRLIDGTTVTVTRQPLDTRLGDDVETMDAAARSRRFTELSQMNSAWGHAKSASTHMRLMQDRTEWDRYHRLYRDARSTWPTVPAHLFASWLDERAPGQVVADLGCGENLLREAVTTVHDIRGFDHVAYDDTVTVCDIAHTPLEDRSVDYAVLSLALMGANHADYLVEAHRILRVDGQLWIAEPASSLGSDEDRLRVVLRAYGFDVNEARISDQFTILRATRAARSPAAVLPPVKESSQGLQVAA